MDPKSTHPINRQIDRQRSRALPLCLAIATIVCGANVSNVASAQEAQSVGQEMREDMRAREMRQPRLRLGFSGHGGGFVGAVHGAFGGASARVGLQMNDTLAFYLQGQALFGEYLPDEGPLDVSAFVFHSAMVDVTIADFFQLGAGPSIDVMLGCVDDGNGPVRCGHTGAYFGSDFRAAFLLGDYAGRRRHAFVLSVDAHPTWVGNDFVTTMIFGLGGEMY